MDCCRVVLTGGPGGGKTTAADLYRRELGEQVVIVPEAATLLYSGGFPRAKNTEDRKAVQQAIYHVQYSLEDVIAHQFMGRVLLCDRGTIDGAAYWPDTDGDFFKYLNSTKEAEFQRYDAVIFFETAAVGGMSIEGGNPVRTESIKQAVDLDKKLHQLWSKHPNFIYIPHNQSFIKKINMGLTALDKIVKEFLK